MFDKIAICTCNIPVNSYPSGLEIENGYIISKILGGHSPMTKMTGNHLNVNIKILGSTHI